MTDYVFICYARKDEEFVLKLATNLKQKGVVVWLDQWDIPLGANWNRTIDEAIFGCAQFLIVLSPEAVESRRVEGEWVTALEEKKSIVPIHYRECRIPSRLRLIQRVDFINCKPGESTALEQILRVLNMKVPTPPEPEVPDGSEESKEASRRAKEKPKAETSEAKPSGTEPDKPDLLLGKMYWSHQSSYGVDTIEKNGIEGHHSISFTRHADDRPNTNDYSIGFDLTSHCNNQVRIVGIDIDVLHWKPITQKLISLVPYMELGVIRKYFGIFRKEKGHYPTTFGREGHFVKLSRKEIEVFEVQINTPDEGIYDLRLAISYSVSGKTKILVTETNRDLWFVNSRFMVHPILWFRTIGRYLP
jgi:hypothetical protein